MTVDMPRARRRKRTLPRSAEPEALKQLPTRRPASAAPASSEIQWSLIDPARYEVKLRNETIGFIDVAGAVFVALAGSRYDRAVESTQTLIFEDALQALEQRR